MLHCIRDSKKNSKKEILSSLIKDQEYNLTNYSANAQRTDALVGYKQEWCDASEKLALLTQMYDELPDKNGYCTYIGTIQDHCFLGGQGYIKFSVLAPATKMHHEVFYFKLCMVVEMKVSKIPTVAENTLSTGIVAVKVKDGIIKQIDYLEEGEF